MKISLLEKKKSLTTGVTFAQRLFCSTGGYKNQDKVPGAQRGPGCPSHSQEARYWDQAERQVGRGEVPQSEAAADQKLWKLHKWL